MPANALLWKRRSFSQKTGQAHLGNVTLILRQGFRPTENGWKESGSFKFVLVSRQAGEMRKISRAISYGHGPARIR